VIKHELLLEELEKIAKEETVPVVDNITIVDQDRRHLDSRAHLTEEAKLRLAEALKSEIVPYIKRQRTDARQHNATASR
jgi:hypothetical protein